MCHYFLYKLLLTPELNLGALDKTALLRVKAFSVPIQLKDISSQLHSLFSIISQ